MSNICIIPARQGSKRIPGKNIRLFLGKPLISYAIQLAFDSGFFDEIMVSTDSEEIASISRNYGANVPFLRSKKNADDHAPLKDVVEEVLAKYPSNFKYGCCLLPGTPLLQVGHLQAGYDLMKSGKFDSVRPLVKYEHPIQRAMLLTKDGGVSWNQPEAAMSRTQDLSQMYHDAGQFYWFHGDQGLTANARGGFEIDRMFAQDIDDEYDWQLAIMKYKLLHQMGS